MGRAPGSLSAVGKMSLDVRTVFVRPRFPCVIEGFEVRMLPSQTGLLVEVIKYLLGPPDGGSEYAFATFASSEHAFDDDDLHDDDELHDGAVVHVDLVPRLVHARWGDERMDTPYG